ncbi:translation initiation factor Sui1 [mine drainage metagenome]|uniref:Translation initiation factor Sui1 n=1 Tax=mine drainage metagenome TaxID=410659 RepID=A0A1J5SI91_9ZZZZ
MSSNRIPTDGGDALKSNPFAAIQGMPQLPAGKPVEQKSTAPSPGKPARSRGRVDIVRQTAGRGGKTVTVISGFLGISPQEKEDIAKRIQRACGCGGSVKDGRIEIQGDKRQEAAKVLVEAGFKPVFAGG